MTFKNIVKNYMTGCKKTGIKYKPNDRTKLHMSVTALLLGKHSNTILQIAIKPKCISKKKHSEIMQEKMKRARKQGIIIIFLYEENFEDLNVLKEVL